MKKIHVSLLAALSLAATIFTTNVQAQNPPASPKLYLDVHHLGAGNVTAAAVADAHVKDLAIQDQYGVRFLAYWVDEAKGTVYCLSEATDEAMISKTHAEAHGLIPDEVKQVACGHEAEAIGKHKYFLDVHDLGPGNVTAEAVAEAHVHDLEVQDKYGVNFINYWVDEQSGKVYCLSEAKDAESVVKTHTEAHGLVPDEVQEVVYAK